MALLVSFLVTLSPTYGQWTTHIIDPNIAYSCIIDVYDMGNDGDVDLFVTEYGANSLLWYENNDRKLQLDVFIK